MTEEVSLQCDFKFNNLIAIKRSPGKTVGVNPETINEKAWNNHLHLKNLVSKLKSFSSTVKNPSKNYIYMFFLRRFGLWIKNNPKQLKIKHV